MSAPNEKLSMDFDSMNIPGVPPGTRGREPVDRVKQRADAALPILVEPVELLSKIRELNPHGRYARYSTGSAIGEWIPTLNRFAPLYLRFVDGRWLCTLENGVIRETLVNGESIYKPENWIE